MTITAKFRGVCSVCGGTIHAGDKIEWSKGSPARHSECPSEAGEPPIPRKPSGPRKAAKVAPGPIRLSGGSGYGSNGWTVGDVIASNGRAGSTADLRHDEYDAALALAVARLAPPKLAYTLWDGSPARESYADTAAHQAAVAVWKTDTDFASRAAAHQKALAEDDKARRDADKRARAEIAAQFPADDGPRWLVIVTASKRYVREDGMSFGVGDEQGYSYQATARAATDAEAAPLVAALRVKLARAACTAALVSALKYGAPGVESVSDTGHLPPAAEIEAKVELGRKTGASGAVTDGGTTYALTATSIVAQHGGYYDDYRSSTRTIARTDLLAAIVEALAAGDVESLVILADGVQS